MFFCDWVKKMKRMLIRMAVSALIIGLAFASIEISAPSKNTSLTSQSNQRYSFSYFRLDSTNWFYKNGDIQVHTTRHDSGPFIEELATMESPLHRLRTLGSGNVTTIHEESTSQAIVIKLSSVHEIQIKNLSVEYVESVVNRQWTDLSETDGVYLVDASGAYHDFLLSACLNLQNDTGTLQYVKLGPFVYDNRAKQDFVGWMWTCGIGLGNYSLPPGDWYFIFYAGFYDVPNNNTRVQTNITINIIDKPDDLAITKNEQGTYTGLWYGELNPVFALSKAWEFDTLLHGHAQFLVHNSLYFEFFGFPVSDGYWHIHWQTPSGIKKCDIRVLDGVCNSSSSDEEILNCTTGHGGSGRYRVTTSSLDRAYKDWTTCLLHLSAVDVPLK